MLADMRSVLYFNVVITSLYYKALDDMGELIWQIYLVDYPVNQVAGIFQIYRDTSSNFDSFQARDCIKLTGPASGQLGPGRP